MGESIRSDQENLSRESRYQDRLTEERLQRLYDWLSVGQAWGLVLQVLWVVALLYAPWMMYVLFRARKYWWILLYFLFMGAGIGFAFVFRSSSVFYTLLSLIPLVAYVSYCVMLRAALLDWLGDLRGIEPEILDPPENKGDGS